MKKIVTLSLLAVAAIALQAKVYTFADLAAIENSGVTLVDGAYVVSVDATLSEAVTLDDGGLTVSKTQITINEGNSLQLVGGEVIKFAGSAQLVVMGEALLNPETGAIVTAAEGSEGTAKGFWVKGETANAVVENIDFKYVGFTFSNGTEAGHLEMRNCTMDQFNGKNSQQAISFNARGDGNIIDHCTFTGAKVSAIGNGSNTPVGIVVSNCTFMNNSTDKRNRPVINLSVGNYDVIIENNLVKGLAENTLAGGIAVSNLLGSDIGDAKIYVRNNVIQDNRYGITLTGKGHVFIEDNAIINNHWDSNPMTGGSGINITDSKGYANAFIKGNLVTGSYWGISIIGAETTVVNVGKIDDPEAEDYNPGLNVLRDNGVDGALYDLYNNSPITVYAQGNVWGVSKQTRDEIATVIYDKNDDETLGEVIFWSGDEPVTGDVNRDGIVNGSDVTKLYNILLDNEEEPTE
ncbi:MAG: hypothetical protein J6X70_10670 [Muribaculaceae bacterium]|nr:hypothetical protein [Muribaculaceae bacterium]